MANLKTVSKDKLVRVTELALKVTITCIAIISLIAYVLLLFLTGQSSDTYFTIAIATILLIASFTDLRNKEVNYLLQGLLFGTALISAFRYDNVWVVCIKIVAGFIVYFSWNKWLTNKIGFADIILFVSMMFVLDTILLSAFLIFTCSGGILYYSLLRCVGKDKKDNCELPMYPFACITYICMNIFWVGTSIAV